MEEAKDQDRNSQDLKFPCNEKKNGKSGADFFREMEEVKEQGENSQDLKFPCNEKKMGKVGQIFS